MIDVERVDLADDAWDRYVDRSSGTTPFYRAGALDLQAEHTATTVHTLVGFKGQEPVGVFPVFEYRKGPISTAFSPAPRSWIGYLGPAMLDAPGLKQRKADRRIRSFVDGCLEYVDEHISPSYTRFVVGGFEDVRPFEWRDYTVTPSYSYVVDLTDDPEELLMRFSSDARRNVRNARENERISVEIGSAADAGRIAEQVRDRYERQGRVCHLTAEYVVGLCERLPDDAIRPFVCRVDGEFAGGIVVLCTDHTYYRWQGGVRVDDVDLSVNDLLDWSVMTDAIDRGVTSYDLVGAGVPSINRYKAKFNPQLTTNFTITGGRFGLSALVERYRKLR